MHEETTEKVKTAWLRAQLLEKGFPPEQVEEQLAKMGRGEHAIPDAELPRVQAMNRHDKRAAAAQQRAAARKAARHGC